MYNIEISNVFLPVYDDTHTSHVTSTGDHDEIACIKFDELGDLVLLKVELDGIVDLDQRIGVTNCATVVSNNMGDTLGTNCDSLDFEELVGCFLWCDAVDRESTLNIVEETEVLARFFDCDDICTLFNIHLPQYNYRIERTLESTGVGLISPDFSINFDQALLDNSSDFTASKGIL